MAPRKRKPPSRIRERKILPVSDMIIDASDAVVATLVAGGGIGFSASFVAVPHVARGELVPALADFAVKRDAISALWALYPSRRPLSARVSAFLDYLKAAFPEGTPQELAAYIDD